MTQNSKSRGLVEKRVQRSLTSLVKGRIFIKENPLRRWRQRLERCVHKPRNAKDCQLSPDARKEGWNRFSHSASEGTNPADALISKF